MIFFLRAFVVGYATMFFSSFIASLGIVHGIDAPQDSSMFMMMAFFIGFHVMMLIDLILIIFGYHELDDDQE